MAKSCKILALFYLNCQDVSIDRRRTVKGRNDVSGLTSPGDHEPLVGGTDAVRGSVWPMGCGQSNIVVGWLWAAQAVDVTRPSEDRWNGEANEYFLAGRGNVAGQVRDFRQVRYFRLFIFQSDYFRRF